jgi:hypothetical protein
LSGSPAGRVRDVLPLATELTGGLNECGDVEDETAVVATIFGFGVDEPDLGIQLREPSRHGRRVSGASATSLIGRNRTKGREHDDKNG